MQHLTEDQIDELLMGSLEASEATRMREHAAGCETCAAQLAGIEVPIASFNAVTLAWSERRSATMPVRPAPVRSGTRWAAGLGWGSVAAAALLAAVIPILRHEQNVHVQQAYNHVINQPAPNQPSDTSSATSSVAGTNSASAQNDSASIEVQENPQEIASDNQMLAMVDEELNAPIPALGSITQGRGHTHSTTQGTVQD